MVKGITLRGISHRISNSNQGQGIHGMTVIFACTCSFIFNYSLLYYATLVLLSYHDTIHGRIVLSYHDTIALSYHGFYTIVHTILP